MAPGSLGGAFVGGCVCRRLSAYMRALLVMYVQSKYMTRHVSRRCLLSFCSHSQEQLSGRRRVPHSSCVVPLVDLKTTDNISDAV